MQAFAWSISPYLLVELLEDGEGLADGPAVMDKHEQLLVRGVGAEEEVTLDAQRHAHSEHEKACEQAEQLLINNRPPSTGCPAPHDRHGQRVTVAASRPLGHTRRLTLRSSSLAIAAAGRQLPPRPGRIRTDGAPACGTRPWVVLVIRWKFTAF